MKRLIMSAMALVVGLNAPAQTKTKVTVEVEESTPPPAAVRKVALVVQNHAAPGANIPFMALTDALTAKLSGRGFQVVNPYNNVGVNQNRNVLGEETPEVSAMELGRRLGVEGIVTASVLEFLDSTIGTPPVLHQYSVRVSFNLADAQTGAAVCGETIKMKSPKYTNNQVAQNRAEYLGDLLHAAVEECAERLEKNPALQNWRPERAPSPLEHPKPKSVVGVTETAETPPPRRFPPRKAPDVAGEPPPQQTASESLVMRDLDAAVADLMAKMRDDSRFIENYDSAKRLISRLPVAVVGGIEDKTGAGVADLLEAAGATVRVTLFDSGLFEVKDDEVMVSLAKRIVESGNSAVEDGELMSALKQHGSPDFFVVGDLRRFADAGGRVAWRLRIALHSLANGKVVWEGIHTIVK